MSQILYYLCFTKLYYLIFKVKKVERQVSLSKLKKEYNKT